jgi:hypothetical protein
MNDQVLNRRRALHLGLVSSSAFGPAHLVRFRLGDR